MKIRIKRLDLAAKIPSYVSFGSSGADIYSVISKDIAPKKLALIPTGIAIEMPEGFEAQIRPRSGIALRYGVTILNAPGTIDADYRGEIKIILINLGEEIFKVRRGMRIAQMVFTRVEQVKFEVVDELGKTERGNGGFGHSDLSKDSKQ
ncbi:MAG: dUTP diphosphatase [Candidatus Cloacimonadota bacterium]|nr:MAG: dUTP diphosphatase [Candidatus Cloacimonadota bacterium]